MPDTSMMRKPGYTTSMPECMTPRLPDSCRRTHTGTADDPLSLNLYTYVKNNPLIYYDPTGHAEVRYSYHIYLSQLGSGNNYVSGYYPTPSISAISAPKKGDIWTDENYFESVFEITNYKNGYGIYEEVWWQDLNKIKKLLSVLNDEIEVNGDIFLPTMQPNDISDVRIMMVLQKALWTSKVTGVWDGGTLSAIENIHSHYGVHKDASTYHLSKELIGALIQNLMNF